MNDYRLTFPVASLDRGVRGVKALREATNVSNALGDPRDANGNIVIIPPHEPGVPPPDVWYGRPGSTATTVVGPNGETIDIPAKGDPSLYYVHVRSEQDAPSFDPTEYEMKDADAVDSAAVLGIWFGDEVPV